MYTATMGAAGAALVAAAAPLLQSPADLGYDCPNDEFGQRLCDTMAAFGDKHLATLQPPELRNTFLQQVPVLQPCVLSPAPLHHCALHPELSSPCT